MNKKFWKQFPVMPDLHCLELKDRIQARVIEETRDTSPAGLVAYFRHASRHFLKKVGQVYPESTPTLLTVHETKDRTSKI